MDDHFLYYNHNKIATIKSYTARNTSRRCWLVEYCICSLSQKQTFPFGCYIHAQFLNWFSRESRAPAEIMTTRSAVEQCGSLFCLFEGKPNVPSVHCFRSCSNEWEYHWPTNVAMHQQGGERQTLRQFKIYKKKGEMLSRQMCSCVHKKTKKVSKFALYLYFRHSLYNYHNISLHITWIMILFNHSDSYVWLSLMLLPLTFLLLLCSLDSANHFVRTTLHDMINGPNHKYKTRRIVSLFHTLVFFKQPRIRHVCIRV